MLHLHCLQPRVFHGFLGSGNSSPSVGPKQMGYLHDQSIFVNSAGLGFKKRKQVMVNNFRKRNADGGSCARCGPNNLLCSKLLCGYCGPGLRLVALIWRIRQRRPIAKLQEDLNRSRHHRRLHQNQIITLVTHSAHSNMLSAHFNVAV